MTCYCCVRYDAITCYESKPQTHIHNHQNQTLHFQIMSLTVNRMFIYNYSPYMFICTHLSTYFSFSVCMLKSKFNKIIHLYLIIYMHYSDTFCENNYLRHISVIVKDFMVKHISDQHVSFRLMTALRVINESNYYNTQIQYSFI
jgi:hypothetical protein